jgi:hypothetical protein
VGGDDGRLSVRFVLREPCTPELILGSGASGTVEVVAHEPSTRPASLTTDPDAIQWPGLPGR